MVLFPNAKINIGLHVLGKRPDGYHDLASLFYPVPLCDALEIIETGEEDQLVCSGLPIQGDQSNNLAWKAIELIRRDHPQLPKLKAHLHKHIPMGAGLGGGSADGAFMLKLLNQKFSLGLSEEKLREYALLLGSDCPFFISNRPSYVTGRGETMTPANIDLSGYRIFLVNPGIHVPTGWAFGQVKPGGSQDELAQQLKRPVHEWKGLVINDFEKPVAAAYPAIGELTDKLYALGAIYASMTGSGSTVFGIFEKNAAIDAKFPENYFQFRL